MGSTLLTVLIALMAVSVLLLAGLPAYLMWRVKRQLRWPLGWIAIVCVMLVFAGFTTMLQLRRFPVPQPIRETLSNVTDQSGSLTVSALRLPDPKSMQAHLEVDVENKGASDRFLGVQYIADGSSLGGSSYALGTTRGASVQPVPANWKGTLRYPLSLPAFGPGGNIVVVLAVCKKVDSEDGDTLPSDSEALYQEHFTLVPKTGDSPAGPDS